MLREIRFLYRDDMQLKDSPVYTQTSKCNSFCCIMADLLRHKVYSNRNLAGYTADLLHEVDARRWPELLRNSQGVAISECDSQFMRLRKCLDQDQTPLLSGLSLKDLPFSGLEIWTPHGHFRTRTTGPRVRVS